MSVPTAPAKHSKVYLSGPIAGKEDKNRHEFREVEYEWTQAGWIVLNPTEFVQNLNKSWEECLRYDLKVLLDCDAVAVLPEWFLSRGASLEVAVAWSLNIPVYGGISGTTIEVADKNKLNLPTVATPERFQKIRGIALQADDLVNGARQADYGHPLDNFSLTGKFWSAILGTEVTAEQVALMMVALKMAREIHKPQEDNLVDGIGYFLTLDLVKKEREKRNE